MIETRNNEMTHFLVSTNVSFFLAEKVALPLQVYVIRKLLVKDVSKFQSYTVLIWSKDSVEKDKHGKTCICQGTCGKN